MSVLQKLHERALVEEGPAAEAGCWTPPVSPSPLVSILLGGSNPRVGPKDAAAAGCSSGAEMCARRSDKLLLGGALLLQLLLVLPGGDLVRSSADKHRRRESCSSEQCTAKSVLKSKQ